MDKLKAKQAGLERRQRRVRGKVSGTAERPRLRVTRTNAHIYAQVIDDVAGTTLAAASTVDPEVRKALKNGANIDAARPWARPSGRARRLRASPRSSSTVAAASITAV